MLSNVVMMVSNPHLQGTPQRHPLHEQIVEIGMFIHKISLSVTSASAGAFGFFLALTFLSSAAGAQPAPSFCGSLNEKTAATSPECVRWHFACDIGKPAQNPAPPVSYIPYQDRMRLLVELTFKRAEVACERFSYVEAWAALQAHLRMLPPK